MDLVSLMYQYINKFINSDQLLKELEESDLTKYRKEEIQEIEKLVVNIKKIKKTVPNDTDEIEINRLKTLDKILNSLEKAKNSDIIDEKTKEIIYKQYEKLLEDKKNIRDGGKLYLDICDILTNNSLINKYAKKMNDKELLEFITKYISAPFPPKINQEEFNDLVNVGIKEDKKEALWRLAFNYNKSGMNFSLIEDYFIEKRDDYYLVELVSAVQEDLNINKLIDKVKATKDKEFINNAFTRAKDIGLITEEELDKFVC